MESGNKREIAVILKQYRFKSGDVNFPAIFNIPTAQRLPELYKENYLRATALVGMGLATAFDRMVFRKKPSGELVNQIAEEILDTCEEDNLSLEDLMLFLQGLVRGTYGEVSEISIAKFMNLFDQYRQERYDAIINFRENEHIQFKSLGSSERSSKSDELAEHFASMSQTISELKNEWRSLKKENNNLKNNIPDV